MSFDQINFTWKLFPLNSSKTYEIKQNKENLHFRKPHSLANIRNFKFLMQIPAIKHVFRNYFTFLVFIYKLNFM